MWHAAPVSPGAYAVLNEHTKIVTYVPRLIIAPIAEVELGFTPGARWPGAVAVAAYTESPTRANSKSS